MMKFTLILLLFTLSQALTVRQVEKALASANRAEQCRERLQRKIDRVEKALATAIKCRLNGLTPEEFKQKLQLCRKRSAVKKELTACKRTSADCSGLEQEFQETLDACRAIGRPKNRNRCKRVHPIRKRLAKLKKRKCPKEADIGALTILLHTVANARQKQLGLPSSPYDIKIFEPTDGPAKNALILLHGVLSNTDSLLPIVDGLMESMPRTRIILPQANEAFVTFLNATGPSWFDILSNDVSLTSSSGNVEEVAEAAANMNDIAEVQRRVYKIDGDRILIGGFSQGAALSLSVSLRYIVGAASSLVGFLPDITSYPEAIDTNGTGTPTLMVNAIDDEIVPIEAARATRDVLTNFQRNVTYVELEDTGHSLEGRIPEVVSMMAKFYNEAVGGL